MYSFSEPFLHHSSDTDTAIKVVHAKKTFNLDAEECDRCMMAVLNGEDYDPDGQPASVQNICKRYDTVCARFPYDLHAPT